MEIAMELVSVKENAMQYVLFQNKKLLCMSKALQKGVPAFYPKFSP